MDLEMTGLDPRQHVIVELACLLTDDDLELVAEGPDLVVHADDAALDAMEEVVRTMHAKSGLTPAVRASTLTLEAASHQIMEFLRAHISEPGSVPLCGNSIGTDRRFLAEQLPELERFFHYRSVDVSTVKELCRRWYPDALSSAPAKKGGHRAMDDIKESLEELRYYRRAIFRDPPPTPAAAPPAAPGPGPSA
jgi:oligoribonuclease